MPSQAGLRPLLSPFMARKMSKALIIAEKPSVARDIVAALGGFSPAPQTPPGVSIWESNEFICCHALGHLLDLYEPEDYNAKLKSWRLSDLPVVPDSFLLKPKSETAQLYRTIKQQLSRPDVTEIINACDAAREGELIFREIVEHSLCNKPSTRVWLQSLTPDAIRSAFASRKPAHAYNGLSNAAHGRSQADWLIGMNLSRAATLKLARASDGGVWSVGRVQTPTLAMLVEREFAILTHDPRPYELIKATFATSDHSYEGKWIESSTLSGTTQAEEKSRISNPERSKEIHSRLLPGTSATATETRKSREQKAPPPFTLTALQRHMANRYKWTAKQTLDVAQKCYETYKVITYPRTESDALPEDYRDKVLVIFEKLKTFAAYSGIAEKLVTSPWHNDKTVFDNKAVKDHFAIIPTGNFPASLPTNEGLLFDAVIRRTMAALMPPSIIDQVERTTVVAGETFVSGPEEFVRVPGWQESLVDAASRRKKELSLKPLIAGDEIKLLDAKIKQDQTKPPPRIGEAQLLSLMEHAGRQVSDPEMARALRDAGGLGTAATRAEIIENLKSKDYVYGNLQPTTKGLHLIRFLKLARAENLTSPQLTAELEQHLSMVEASSRTRDSFIQETARSVNESLKAITSFDLEKSFDHAPSVGPCPRCKGTVHERMWNYTCQSNRQTDDGCGFTIPKDCDGRWLDPPSISRLLVAGETGLLLDGFPTAERSSRSPKRLLMIKNGILEINDEFGKPLEGTLHTAENKSSTKRRVTWGACPVHKADGCLIVETKNAFICETKLKFLKEGQTETVGFQLPKSICEQRLKFEDINSFIRTGRTRVIEGFKSRGGKVFDASIVRSPAGSWTFEFRS